MSKQLDPTIAAMTREHTPHKPVPEPHAEDEPGARVLIWTLVVIGVLFVAIILFRSAFVTTPKAETVTYNNFEFTQLPDTFWQFRWQREDAIFHVPLRYNPLQLENVTVKGTLSPSFGNRRDVYVTIDPSNQSTREHIALAAAELTINLGKVFGVNVVPACTRNDSYPCNVYETVTCQNPGERSVIYLQEAPGPAVEQRGDCIVVRGERWDIVQAVDRILYKFYKVMDD